MVCCSAADRDVTPCGGLDLHIEDKLGKQFGMAGFAEGFLVHDELLGIPKRDRLACVPNGESAIQIVRVMKRYLANNPEKAHRATRYIASLALAGAFPCRGGK
jgi:Rap1a immunity proteins